MIELTSAAKLVVALGALLPAARAADDPLAKFATPLSEDRVFYRWQSTSSGENLTRAKTMTEELNRHFMGMTDNIQAGPGIYFASNELSSASYLPSEGGNLIEMHLPKGIPVIDTGDYVKMAELTQAGIDIEALRDGRASTSAYVLKYTDDWYVGKNLTGRARFEMYPGAAQTPERVSMVLDAVERQNHLGEARDQIHRQIMSTPAARRRELFAADPLHPLHLASLSPDEFAAQIDRALADHLDRHQFEQLVGHFARDPRAAARLAKADPARAAHLADAVVAASHDRLLNLPPPAVKALVGLAKVGDANDPRRRARLLRLAYDGLGTSNLIDRLPETRERVVPLLRALDLSAEERAFVARQLAVVFRFPNLYGNQAGELKKLAAAAAIDDPTLTRKIAALATRKKRLDRASSPRTIDDVVAGLREHEGFAQFAQTYRTLAARIPNRMMDEAYELYVSRHAAEYAALFKDGDDLATGALYRANLSGKSFEVMYEAALGANAGARQKFLESCLGHEPCAGALGARVRADGGRIFSGVTDLNRIEANLTRLTADAPEVARPFANFKAAAERPIPNLTTNGCVSLIERTIPR